MLNLSIALFTAVKGQPVSKCYSSKVEVKLTKVVLGQQWPTLDDSAGADLREERPKYPSSSKKPLDLEVLDELLKETGAESDKNVDAFFKELYRNADEDTRRAMNKSFVIFLSD